MTRAKAIGGIIDLRDGRARLPQQLIWSAQILGDELVAGARGITEVGSASFDAIVALLIKT